MAGIEDPVNITGISDLVDRSHANGNIKLEELERDLVGGLQMMEIHDPNSEFESRMQHIMEEEVAPVHEEGAPEDDLGPAEPEAPKVPYPNPNPYASPPNRTPNRSPAASPAYAKQPQHQHQAQASHPPPRNPPSYPQYQAPQTYPPHHPAPGYPPQYPPQGYPSHPQSYPQGYPQAAPNHGYQSSNPGHQLDEALRNYGGQPGFEIDPDFEEETKAIMLDDIEELLSELRGYGTDVSRIPKVDADSSFKEIKDVHQRLRLKYDTKRCHTFGNDLIMAAAHGLEWIFDGKKSYGPLRPDLTDWHNNIRPKLRRMRYETSSVVRDVMHGYGIGNLARIALELGISAVLHSKARQMQKGQSAYTPDQMNEAYESLRDYEA